MTAYYNENDPLAVAWLRQLIDEGLLPYGYVDDRSILDVTASDLEGFTQHHFFAGIGGWPLALRRAGWADSKPVCSASLPCQPFSVAGKKKGKEDERHLLPHFMQLVKTFHFPVMFGEQVAAAFKQGWIDDLYSEMEALNYTCGTAILTSAGAGSPHERQRSYWVAYSPVSGLQEPHRPTRRYDTTDAGQEQGQVLTGSSRMGDPEYNGHFAAKIAGSHGASVQRSQEEQNRPLQSKGAGSSRTIPRGVGRMGDPEHDGHTGAAVRRSAGAGEEESRLLKPKGSDPLEWWYCRDGKYRPIKSGIVPVVDALPRGMVFRSGESISPNATDEARNMRIKGYGNAIQVSVAENFIRAAIDAMELTEVLL